MNQDFIVCATPATARRLLLLQRVCKITLPDSIMQLATQDRVDDRTFDPMVCPYDPVKGFIAQFLLDNNLRGIIQADYHPEISPLTLLHIVRTQPNIIIITERRQLWSKALTVCRTKAKIVKSIVALDDYDRTASVIYDTEYSSSMNVSAGLRDVVREFPRFIIFDDRRGFQRLIHWSLWARLLCPGMPHPWYPRVAKVSTDWDDLPLVAFATFYNTCIFPHLINIPSIVAALGDDYAIERLKQQASLLTLS